MNNQLAVFLLMFYATCSIAGILGPEFPEAKITVKVVDVYGVPVADANVGVGFSQGGNAWVGEHKSENIKGVSDTNGLFSAQAKCAGGIGVGVDKDGFYRSYAKHDYSGTYQSKERWEPWNPTIEVILKEIKNPVPMYVKHVRTTIPVIDKSIGFDLEKGDWVTPYGEGARADLSILLTGYFNDVKERESRIKILFPNNGDGIQEYRAESVSWVSLRLPHEAPEGDYLQECQKFQYLKPDGSRLNLGVEKDMNYIFRVRTVLDMQGSIVKSHYGKIHGDIEFGFVSPEEAQLIFTYYFNPKVNDRSIEFQPDNNLFGGSTRFAP